MEKVKLGFKQNDFDTEIESYSALLPLFNEVFNAYKTTGLPELSFTEFKQLFTTLKSLIFHKMTDGNGMEMGGFKMNPETAFDIVQKPEGYQELLTAIEKAKDEQHYAYHLSNCEMTGNEIVLVASLFEKVTEKNTIYARTDKQLKAYEFTKAVIDKAAECFDEGFDINHWLEKFIIPLAGVDRKSKMNLQQIVSYGEPV